MGGTFTDSYLVDNVEEEQTIHRVSTTPEDPSKSALKGVSGVGLTDCLEIDEDRTAELWS